MSSRIIVTVFAVEGMPTVGYAMRTLDHLLEVTNFDRHELFISDNGSCPEMYAYYRKFKRTFAERYKTKNLTISLNGANLGTSGGLNIGLKGRKPNQYCVKLDSDMIIHCNKWVERMEECFERDRRYGIIALKRRELVQRPDHENPEYKTVLRFLPHTRGETWVTVEVCKDLLGSCTMFSPKLLDRIGFATQPSVYGGDDILTSVRSIKAGFENAFIPDIICDHIDDASGEFVQWKLKHAGEIMDAIVEMKNDFESGVRDVYHDPYED